MKSGTDLEDTETEDTFYNKSRALLDVEDPSRRNYYIYEEDLIFNKDITGLSDYLRSLLVSAYEGFDDNFIKKVEGLKKEIATIYMVCINNSINVTEPPVTLVDKLVEDINYITGPESELAGQVINYFTKE